jgi:hypothetical protein
MEHAATPGLAADRQRPGRRQHFCILLLAVLLAGCTTQPVAKPAEDLFEHYEVSTGTAHHQTVLTGFFLGSETAELVVLDISESGKRRVQMYGLDDGAWNATLAASLSPGALFVDRANIAGHDRLISYQDGRLNWFDPVSKTEQALLDIATSYKPSEAGEIPHLDITRDLNHDGRDDLVVPDVDGFWIATQMDDGSFTKPVKLGPPEPFRDLFAFGDKHSYGDAGITAQTNPWYQSRLHELDYNRDGRSDLVFWNEDHFDVYLQDETGLFDPVAKTFTTDVGFDSDGSYSLVFGFSDESTFSLITGLRKKTKRTVLQSFRDMNGDGIADLITRSLEGRSLIGQSNRYQVHFGSPTVDGTLFARDVSMALQPQDRAKGRGPSGYSMGWWQDFDADGQIDILFGRVNTGVGGFFRAVLANSISMDIEFYRITDGIYPDQPNGSFRIKPDLEFVIGGRGPFFPTVLLGDVNGDSLIDLLVGENWQELKVHMGVKGPELFAVQPQTVAVDLTANEQNARLVDLNKDEKKDLLVHHPSATEPHRLIVLIAR